MVPSFTTSISRFGMDGLAAFFRTKANSFCDMAMVYAFADGLEKVDWKTVMQVAIDKKNMGALRIL